MQFLKYITLIAFLFMSLQSLASESAGSKAEAAKLAQRQVSGRVLKVEKLGDKYRVKILQSSGRVIFIEINKKSEERQEGRS